jgi:hypothetical protein
MAGVSRWVAGLSRKKQIALGLVGLLLVVWITNAWINDDGGTKAKAQAQAQAQARPAPLWAGITKAQAIAQAEEDEFYADSHITNPVLFESRAQFDQALSGGLMQGPSAERRKCKGVQVWYVTYASSTWPTAWYESKERGDNAFVCADIGTSNSMKVTHGARR